MMGTTWPRCRLPPRARVGEPPPVTGCKLVAGICLVQCHQLHVKCGSLHQSGRSSGPPGEPCLTPSCRYMAAVQAAAAQHPQGSPASGHQAPSPGSPPLQPHLGGQQHQQHHLMQRGGPGGVLERLRGLCEGGSVVPVPFLRAADAVPGALLGGAAGAACEGDTAGALPSALVSAGICPVSSASKTHAVDSAALCGATCVADASARGLRCAACILMPSPQQLHYLCLDVP